KRIVGDLIEEGDTVVLVVPIDSAAPKGRLILPQQQTIRDILESGATAVVTRDTELKDTLDSLKNPPKMIITDSQAFGRVSKDVPLGIPLTSFSILFARYKGNLKEAVRGAAKLDDLADGDIILVSEGCTHHRQCEDIGTVKIPAWVKKHTNKDVKFEFTSGGTFPDDLSKYALVIHCGGCTLNEREMQYRIRHSTDCGVPITNYGIAIAHMHGILKRSVEIFDDVRELLK
ncbi:MAG: [FeFe] hydrogenase H-cluster maturation GTPase HydF, partial [Ruminococcaceae bacterium]|nr:[FeFe] hydrogenase H-cluster maturation GTPase HydF [Oscillospiraceae bacterium]